MFMMESPWNPKRDMGFSEKLRPTRTERGSEATFLIRHSGGLCQGS
jgi:hypothetical protein